MAYNHKFIDIVHKLGTKGYPLIGVYRRIQDKELFLAAYGKLYANQGATTAGTDPEDTVDGMSVERIEEILTQLHSGTYQWKPVRRVEIPKANGKTRPLGIPSWSDKLLQEVIRMVLEAYYEHKFSKYSRACPTFVGRYLRTMRFKRPNRCTSCSQTGGHQKEIHRTKVIPRLG